MIFQINAACCSNIGKVRSNNEDNLYFNGRYLNQKNDGLKRAVSIRKPLETELCFGVFDGMGGEAYGEIASYAATVTLKKEMEKLNEEVQSPRYFLENACEAMNLAVCEESRRLMSGRMGTTMALLLFTTEEVYVCNIGDSRVYRLRDNELLQISEEHAEKRPNGAFVRKGRLTQHLGIFPDDLILEPHIAKGSLKQGDTFLICSDGLTDMVSNLEISRCLKEHISVKRSAEHLVDLAMDHGGRDNTTVIVIKVQ